MEYFYPQRADDERVVASMKIRSLSARTSPATLLSAIESCRASGRSAIEFFGRALSETSRGRSGQLSLIPRFD